MKAGVGEGIGELEMLPQVEPDISENIGKSRFNFMIPGRGAGGERLTVGEKKGEEYD